jgi:hypothetical protein
VDRPPRTGDPLGAGARTAPVIRSPAPATGR